MFAIHIQIQIFYNFSSNELYEHFCRYNKWKQLLIASSTDNGCSGYFNKIHLNISKFQKISLSRTGSINRN